MTQVEQAIEDHRIFEVEGFGPVGPANLWAFIPLTGQPCWQDLQIYESTVGYATGCGEGQGKRQRTERVVRIR